MSTDEQPVPVSEADLLARIARGDEEAFTVLFRRRRGDVYRFALHMTGVAAIAEDVTQEVFVAVMRDAGRYEAGRSTVKAWLCGIARNHALRHLDARRSSVPLADVDRGAGEIPAICPDPAGDLARAEEVEALRKAIVSLPVAYREAVVLCDLQEFSYQDAAAVLGCALGTVRSRLHRGRVLLASKMGATEAARQPGSGRRRCFA